MRIPESSMRKWRICTFLKSVIGRPQNTISWAFPKMFLSACRTRIPRCQRFHATERVSPGLNDNILRYTNSFVPPRRTLWWVSSWWLSCLSSLRHEQQ